MELGGFTIWDPRTTGYAIILREINDKNVYFQT